MTTEQHAGTRIELSYGPTIEDFREALRAHARVSASRRRAKWLMIASAGLVLFTVALSLTAEGPVDLPIPVMVMPVVFLLVMLGLPWLQARQFHRLSAAGGECRTVVDGSGVTVTNQQQSSVQTWQAMPRYAETKRVFVLFSGDRNASALTILPKRGANSAADVDRMRAVFDRHLTRA
ncbi:YcxB family protein [Streptomyces sp. NPDC003077]|uniref:YcxB family protein n=1 Tax=Streptomyces sp. NPDC003077 TaxID=3154443 RepID=UPI0033B26FA4